MLVHPLVIHVVEYLRNGRNREKRSADAAATYLHKTPSEGTKHVP